MAVDGVGAAAFGLGDPPCALGLDRPRAPLERLDLLMRLLVGQGADVDRPHVPQARAEHLHECDAPRYPFRLP
jgi:hypothetical protein